MNSLWRNFRNPVLLFRAVSPKIQRNFLHNVACKNSLYVAANQTNLCSNNIYLDVIRYKSKKAKYDSDDDDEDIIFNEDSSLSKDSKVMKFNTTSLRTDLILKSALGIARNKIEQQFYESKIRVNGKKIMKKSAGVRQGDEIDVVKMVSPKNPDHLYVARVEIMNIAAKEESIAITARVFKNLLIETYEDDPYKGSAETENQ